MCAAGRYNGTNGTMVRVLSVGIPGSMSRPRIGPQGNPDRKGGSGNKPEHFYRTDADPGKSIQNPSDHKRRQHAEVRLRVDPHVEPISIRHFKIRIDTIRNRRDPTGKLLKASRFEIAPFLVRIHVDRCVHPRLKGLQPNWLIPCQRIPRTPARTVTNSVVLEQNRHYSLQGGKYEEVRQLQSGIRTLRDFQVKEKNSTDISQDPRIITYPTDLFRIKDRKTGSQ